MKKGWIAGVCLWLTVTSRAQQEISMDSLSRHTGDSVTVCTRIYGGIYLDRSKGTPTLLNAGGAYPNAPLTLVIWAGTREKFASPPEEFYRDKNVCISGKIILYKDKPEIVIYDEQQIRVK